MLAVSTTWNVPVDWMLNHRRSPRYSTPRQIAMALARRLTHRSYPEIGRRFRKDHTTALHASRKYSDLLDEAEAIVGFDADALTWSGALLTILRSKQ
jgi:chromosomal replication initiator protein